MRPRLQWSFFRRFATEHSIPDNLKPPVEPNKLFGPTFQEWCYNKMGFNQYGLMRDDMIHETPMVKEALKRLPDHIIDERNFRMVRAGYLCMKKEVLPKEQWTLLKNDVMYLSPIIEQVKKEWEEKENWEKE